MSPELIRLTKSPSKTFYSSVEALIIKNLSDLLGIKSDRNWNQVLTALMCILKSQQSTKCSVESVNAFNTCLLHHHGSVWMLGASSKLAMFYLDMQM